MSKIYRDIYGNEIPDEPDDKPAAEIRGGDRPEDYMPSVSREPSKDVISLWDDDDEDDDEDS